MGILAAEDGVNLDNFLLPHQRVEIMRNRNQVHFRRQLVRRMTPVAVGKNAQPARGKLLDLVLHVREVSRRILVPLRVRLRDFRSLLWICLQRVHNVDPVKRVQMVKVHYVILHVLSRHHDIAD